MVHLTLLCSLKVQYNTPSPTWTVMHAMIFNGCPMILQCFLAQFTPLGVTEQR
jgi:hypothetical protein